MLYSHAGYDFGSDLYWKTSPALDNTYNFFTFLLKKKSDLWNLLLMGHPTNGTFFAVSLSKKCPISWQMTVLISTTVTVV